MSQTSKSIHDKLLEFQKEGVSIKKSADNPHFRSKYADLGEVISKARPALNKVGIVLMQIPNSKGLCTILRDPESNTEIKCFLPYFGATDVQKLGSNLTYLRRYSLVTLLGLEDDDDDGNTASAKEVNVAKPKAPVKPQITQEQAFSLLRSSISLEELRTNFTKLPKAMREDVEMIALKDELKASLTA